MKNLYQLQSLLVVIFLSMITSWTYGQLGDPILVNVRNSGSSFTDQFSASIDYSYGIVQDVTPQLGLANIAVGSGSNTLKVTFTPDAGAKGTTDLVVNYFSLSAPMHPVTRW